MCYKRLVVSEDAALRYLYERKHEMLDAGYRAYRADWLARFQQHLFGAEKLQAMVCFLSGACQQLSSLRSGQARYWHASNSTSCTLGGCQLRRASSCRSCTEAVKCCTCMRLESPHAWAAGKHGTT